MLFVSSLFPRLQVLPCVALGSSVRVFTAPGYVIAVLYNGILLRPNQAPPFLSCSIVGNLINLNFSIESGDNIYALCVA